MNNRSVIYSVCKLIPDKCEVCNAKATHHLVAKSLFRGLDRTLCEECARKWKAGQLDIS